MFEVWYGVEWACKDENGNYRTHRRSYYTEVEANNKIFELSHIEGIKDIQQIKY